MSIAERKLRRSVLLSATYTLHESSQCDSEASGPCQECRAAVTPVIDEVLDALGWAEGASTYTKMCAQKRSYKSRGKALKAALQVAHLGPQRAYKCPHCDYYHLTSKRAFTERKAGA